MKPQPDVNINLQSRVMVQCVWRLHPTLRASSAEPAISATLPAWR
jgi:hypothetical protein